jgi:fused signal recognition particle receptor
MAFNWFRRRFNEENSEAAEQTSEQSQSTESADSQTGEVQEDYLAWAKAAYQNIQQRQQVDSAVASDETGEPEESIPEPVLSEAEPSEPVIEPEPVPADDSSASKPSAQPIPAVESSESVATTESEPHEQELTVELVQETPGSQTPETTIETPAELPIWARANAERQARLEQLKRTAIETESIAPPPAQTPTAASPTPAAQPAPDLEPQPVFDEGFLWSAEVLAAQGRRPEEVSVEEITWLQKLRRGLGKTRLGLVNQLKAIVGQGPLNQDAITEIETLLLQADVGVAATDRVIEALQAKMRSEILPPEAAIAYLKEILRNILDEPLKQQHNTTFVPEKDRLNIWLMTGVNGAGKTTTIGKLAHVAGESGYVCLVAAADTFRAAAVEQVKIWAARSGVEVIANPGQNTDPAAVVFDAITAAQSRHANLLLVDTAGRLQNKKNLMDELSKVRRIIDKKAPDARVESLLVLDATLGQNGLRQAQVFAEAAKLTGVVLTKLDGSAKGGIALAVAEQMGLPIRFIGAGEGIKDLRPFSSYEFVEALLSN